MNSATQELPFARRFFARMLPKHIIQHVEKFAVLQGTVSFSVKEQGKWTLRLGNLETPIEEGMAEDADLSLWFSAKAFEEFIKGTLNIMEAITQKNLAFDGDPAMLERFAALMTPSTSALGTRFNR